MSKIARFVIWICSKFTKNEIQQIIAGLLDVLEDRNPEVKPKDDFKEKHPNYRNFSGSRSRAIIALSLRCKTSQ